MGYFAATRQTIDSTLETTPLYCSHRFSKDAVIFLRAHINNFYIRVHADIMDALSFILATQPHIHISFPWSQNWERLDTLI
jgi:hypothetical protein